MEPEKHFSKQYSNEAELTNICNKLDLLRLASAFYAVVICLVNTYSEWTHNHKASTDLVLHCSRPKTIIIAENVSILNILDSATSHLHLRAIKDHSFFLLPNMPSNSPTVYLPRWDPIAPRSLYVHWEAEINYVYGLSIQDCCVFSEISVMTRLNHTLEYDHSEIRRCVIRKGEISVC